MKAIKIQAQDTSKRKLPKNQVEKKQTVRRGLQRSSPGRHKMARSVVDETFAAIAIKKHAKIEQLIDQTKYGD